MSQTINQKCNNCGYTFEEWSCDHCYSKSVLKSGGGNYATIE